MTLNHAIFGIFGVQPSCYATAMPRRRKHGSHWRGAPGTQAHQTHSVLYHRYRPDSSWYLAKAAVITSPQSPQEVVIKSCEDRRDVTGPRPILVRLTSWQVLLVYGALAPKELWPRDGPSASSSRLQPVAMRTRFHIFPSFSRKGDFSCCLAKNTSRLMASGAIGTRAGSMWMVDWL